MLYLCANVVPVVVVVVVVYLLLLPLLRVCGCVCDMRCSRDCSFMFEGATAFNADISGWNVAAVTTMR